VLVPVFVLVVFASCGRRESADGRKSGAEQPAAAAVVLAEIDGRRITLGDFEAEMARRGKSRYQTEQQRQQLLEDLIAFEVMLARARAAGFDRRPEVQSQIDRLIVARFQEEQFAAQPAPTPPTETELRKLYEEQAAEFKRPAEVRAGLIHFACSPKATPEKRAELRHQAAGVLLDARRGDDAAFTALAQEHSADQATRYRGGDTGWLRVGDDAAPWPAAVVNAAAALSRPGDCAPLVETPMGFYVVRLLELKPGGVRAFEEVQDALAYQLQQRQRELRHQNLLEEMKRGMRIETHPEHLPRAPLTEQAVKSAPPPVPGN
jgi:parvulin-like peptidyl-prolyl isomerase